MKTLLLLAMLIPSLSFAQKIKSTEIDKFTKERRILTSQAVLQSGLIKSLGIIYRSVDTTCFLKLAGRNWAVGVVGTNDALVFLLDNDETVRIYPTDIQTYETSRQYGSYYDHQYRISKYQIETLANHNLKSIRRYSSKEYADMDVKDRNVDVVKGLSKVFLDELNKN